MDIQTPTYNLQVLALPTEYHNVNTLLYIKSDDYTSKNTSKKCHITEEGSSFFNIITITNVVLNITVITNIYLEGPIPCPLQDLYIALIAVLSRELISPCFSSYTASFSNTQQTLHDVPTTREYSYQPLILFTNICTVSHRYNRNNHRDFHDLQATDEYFHCHLCVLYVENDYPRVRKLQWYSR